MTRRIAPLLLVAAATACRSASITIEAGLDGDFETRLAIDGKEFVVMGKQGRLLVNDEDRGPIRRGDLVTLYSDGDVEVNGRGR